MLNKSQIKIRVLSLSIIASILNADPIIGNRAPEFSLPDQDGVIRNLGDFRGRKLVVYFFPKADTPGWIKQACGFRDEYDKFEKYNISILGVSYDKIITLKAFRNKYRLKFDLLSDQKKIMGKNYGVNRYHFFPKRKTFLIDENGILVYVYDEVNLHTHPDEILKFFN